MGPLEFVVLAVASVAVVGGAFIVAYRELVRMPGRRRVGRMRDSIEVLVPVAGVIGLVVAAWVLSLD